MTGVRKIDKKHIATVVLFAVKYIPKTNKVTLHKFLELINTTGSFGWITEQQLLAKMKLMLKHVPGTCEDSLLTVLEFLDVCVPLNLEHKQTSLFAPENQPAVLDLQQGAFFEVFSQT
ncbi:hypothetical protein ACFLXQ_05980 [Chloroflexota bacterium]